MPRGLANVGCFLRRSHILSYVKRAENRVWCQVIIYSNLSILVALSQTDLCKNVCQSWTTCTCTNTVFNKHYFLFCFSVLEDLKAKTKLESEEYNSRLQVCNLFLVFISYFWHNFQFPERHSTWSAFSVSCYWAEKCKNICGTQFSRYLFSARSYMVNYVYYLVCLCFGGHMALHPGHIQYSPWLVAYAVSCFSINFWKVQNWCAGHFLSQSRRAGSKHLQTCCRVNNPLFWFRFVIFRRFKKKRAM